MCATAGNANVISRRLAHQAGQFPLMAMGQAAAQELSQLPQQPLASSLGDQKKP